MRRITVVDAACRNGTGVELWVVPLGASLSSTKSFRPCAPSARQNERTTSPVLFAKAAYRSAAAGGAVANAAGPRRQEPPQCPSVRVSCADTDRPGEAITFTAELSGGKPAGAQQPSVAWTVSAGTVRGHSRWPTITVDTTGVAGPVTATLDVSGYDRSCATAASCTTNLQISPEARRVDAFGADALCGLRAKLDAFVIELQNDPTARGYIVTNTRAR